MKLQIYLYLWLHFNCYAKANLVARIDGMRVYNKK